MNSNGTADFFEPLMQLSGSKVVCLTLSTLCLAIGDLMCYGIFWFVNYSSEAKPTLINRFIAQACLSGFQYCLLVQVPENIRFLYGPLPESLCYLKQVLRSSYFVEFLLLFNASSIAQYIYIFWLKNPMAFKDDFWCWFVTAAIKLFSLSSQFIWHALTPRQPINYFVCTGFDPTKFSDEPFHVYGVFELLTVFIQIFVQVRIQLYKRKHSCPALTSGSRLVDLEQFSLPSVILNLANATVVMTSTFFMVYVTNMEPQKLVIYPNSIIVQFVFLCLAPIIGAFVTTTFYIKHKPLRNAIRKHLPFNVCCGK